MMDSSFRQGGMNATRSLLADALERLGIRKRVREQQVLARWPEIAGSRIAAVTKAERITNGKLFVACKTSAWANELTMLRRELLQRISKLFGSNLVQDIRFSGVGYRKNGDTVNPADKFASVELTAEDEQFVAEVAALVPDDALAERVKRAVIASRMRNAAKRTNETSATDRKR